MTIEYSNGSQPQHHGPLLGLPILGSQGSCRSLTLQQCLPALIVLPWHLREPSLPHCAPSPLHCIAPRLAAEHSSLNISSNIVLQHHCKAPSPLERPQPPPETTLLKVASSPLQRSHPLKGHQVCCRVYSS